MDLYLLVEVGVEMLHTQFASSVTCHIKTLRDVSTLRSDKNSSSLKHLFRDRTGTFLETLHIDTFSPTVFFSINMLENIPKASWNNFICCILYGSWLKKSCQIFMKTRNDKQA